MMNFDSKSFVTQLTILLLAAFLLSSAILNSEELPEGFPPLLITKSDNPSPGAVFMSNRGTLYPYYLAILANDGKSYKVKGVDYENWNFVFQQNGMMTSTSLVSLDGGGWLDAYVSVFDDDLEEVDRFHAGNGLPAGGHEFVMMPNGHYLMLAFEPKYMDMSLHSPNGDPNALVRSSVVQEFDANKNIVYQWNAWDHIPLSETYADFSGKFIYHALFNSMDFDHEGNILISNRLGSEIIKIDRKSGEQIWRLGGIKNEFNFIGEHEQNAPNYFSFQHDIRCLPNGNITLFDNGFQHSPRYSRGVEYELDQVGKNATMVWEFRNETDIFASANGSMRRLPNGNSLIGWGWVASQYKKDLTEVRPDGSIVLEMELPANVGSFRWLKSPWPLNQATADVTLDELLPLNTNVFNNGDIHTGVTIIFSELNSASPYNRVNVKKYEYSPRYPIFDERAPWVAPYKFVIAKTSINSFTGELRFNISELPWLVEPERWAVYHRTTADEGMFTQLVTSYNSSTNEIIAETTEFGEFIFGIPATEQMPNTPTLNSPAAFEMVNEDSPVTFKWSPHGYFNDCRLQIATDITFENVVIDATDKPTFATITDLDNGTEYFWRVMISNEYGESQWSETRSFNTASPYLDITTPIGGEKWLKDGKRNFIRWDKNINDAVKIELLLEGNVVTSIVDSLVSYTGAYAWIVGEDIMADSNYRVRITSLHEPELTTISDEVFRIDGATSVENSDNNSVLSIKNNPNPLSNSTTFEFTTQVPGNASITIYNLLGQPELIVYSSYVEVGNHNFKWDSGNIAPGIYVYKLSVGNNSITNKMVISR
ncbi:MAG: aryl-sulfate sulfotransferase [Candidatus Kapabacteria bacterium]|nr:aryl-sulfate sulfotransferase [Candidatus Kapabacteria bacterium]